MFEQDDSSMLKFLHETGRILNKRMSDYWTGEQNCSTRWFRKCQNLILNFRLSEIFLVFMNFFFKFCKTVPNFPEI